MNFKLILIKFSEISSETSFSDLKKILNELKLVYPLTCSVEVFEMVMGLPLPFLKP